MFTTTTDEDAGIAVWRFSGGETDQDWQAYLDAMALNCGLAARTRHAHAFAVQIVEPGSAIPPAVWRKRIAEGSAHVPRNVLFVLVSASPAVRAVSTALGWLRPQTYEMVSVASLTEAIALVEGRRVGAGAVVARLAKNLRS